MKQLIIDCDPGNGIRGSDIDDGIALCLALASPTDVSLRAVTVVSGNTALEDGYSVARDLFDRAGIDVPVVAGAARALREDPAPWVQHRERSSVPESVMAGWDSVTPPAHYPVPHDDDAAGTIIRLAAEAPGEITLVAVGPLTNVAHALQRRPQLATELAEIVIMGGAFNVPGMLQELNFAMDPEAADIVLGSGANITLVPFDVTSQTRLRLEDMDPFREDGNVLAEYLLDTVPPWIRYIEHEGGVPGCNLHDPLAVAYLLDESLCSWEEYVVGVELVGTLTRSRPIAWTAGGVTLATGLNLPERKPVRVLTGVDNDRLVDLVVDRVAGWQQSSANDEGRSEQ